MDRTQLIMELMEMIRKLEDEEIEEINDYAQMIIRQGASLTEFAGDKPAKL